MKPISRVLFILTIGLFFSATPALAQTSITKVQSLYIYNFAKYIKWAEPGSEIIVGIFAEEAAFKEISSILSARKVGGMPITVKRLTRVDEARGSNIVFIGQTYNWAFRKVNEMKLKNILIVTESDFSKRGASVSFVVRSSRLKFKINREVCERAGLVVSNNLISLGV